mmetsp:Transcript_4320/g.14036  ORF Transcript_4320/g.14036 Transcript_4320/m.14036 type:complete len:116 (+) Transcript_4320:76-423(+)
MSVPPTHTLRVMRAYRSALRLTRNWTVNRELFRNEADKIRAQFEAGRSIPPGKAAESALARAERELATMAHPDPYTFMPNVGGTKWQRNIPPPPSFSFMYYPSETHGKSDVKVEE